MTTWGIAQNAASKHRRICRIAGGLTLGAILAGCSVGPGSQLKINTIGTTDFAATDARLRLVTNSRISAFSRPGQVVPKRILCAEPSPDVAAAVANSFAVGLNILGQGNGAISGAAVEGLAQLVERTASIQLLRDKMYQTCLAFQNGAIGGTNYSILMSQLDSAIITLTFGETAAGRFGASLAALGTEADAEAKATLIGLPGKIAKIEDQAATLKSANKDVDDRQKAHNEFKSKLDKKEIEDNTTNQAKLVELKAELEKAKERRTKTLEALRQAADATAKSAAKVSTVTAVGSITHTPNPAIAESLEDLQETFINDDWAKNYITACMVELARPSEPFPSSITADTARSATSALDRERSRIAAILAETENDLETAQQLHDDAPASEKPEIASLIEDLKVRRDELNEQLAGLTERYENLNTIVALSHPLRQVYSDLRQEIIVDGKSKSRADLFNAASQASPQSMLATHCQINLPKVMETAYKAQSAYRVIKLNNDALVEQAAGLTGRLQAEAALLQTRNSGLDQCDKRFKGDDTEVKKLKSKCYVIFLEPTPSVPPSLIAGSAIRDASVVPQELGLSNN